jgi:hypothetical protein
MGALPNPQAAERRRSDEVSQLKIEWAELKKENDCISAALVGTRAGGAGNKVSFFMQLQELQVRS